MHGPGCSRHAKPCPHARTNVERRESASPAIVQSQLRKGGACPLRSPISSNPPQCSRCLTAAVKCCCTLHHGCHRVCGIAAAGARWAGHSQAISGVLPQGKSGRLLLQRALVIVRVILNDWIMHAGVQGAMWHCEIAHALPGLAGQRRRAAMHAGALPAASSPPSWPRSTASSRRGAWTLRWCLCPLTDRLRI